MGVWSSLSIWSLEDTDRELNYLADFWIRPRTGHEGREGK